MSFLEKVDWAGVKSDCTSMAMRFAKATDTPLDDLAIPMLADFLYEQIRARLSPPVMMAEAVELDLTPAGIEEELKRRGYKVGAIPFWLLTILGSGVGWVVKRILDKFFPPKP